MMSKEIKDILHCISIYDATASHKEKGRYFEIIQKDVIKAIRNQLSTDLPNNEPTIKSVTTCITCGSECEIGGDGETHFYIPKASKLLAQKDKEIADLTQKNKEEIEATAILVKESIELYKQNKEIKQTLADKLIESALNKRRQRL